MGYILSFIVGVIAGVTGLICIAVELDKNQNRSKGEEPWKELERDCNGCFGAAGNDCQKCREDRRVEKAQEKYQWSQKNKSLRL